MDRAVGTHLLRSKPNPAMLYLLALPFAVIGVVASTNGYLNSTYTQLFERALGYVGIAGVCSFQTHRVVMYALVVTNIVLVAVRFLVWSRAYPRLGDPFDMVTVIVDGIMLYAFTFYIFTTGIHDSRDGSRMARCDTANPSGVLCLIGSYHMAALDWGRPGWTCTHLLASALCFFPVSAVCHAARPVGPCTLRALTDPSSPPLLLVRRHNCQRQWKMQTRRQQSLTVTLWRRRLHTPRLRPPP